MNEPNNSEDELHIFQERKLDFPNLSEILAEKPFRELVPIFIKSFRERAKKRTPSEIIRDYELKEDFYGISPIDQREILKFGSIFYSIVPESFDAVELSPISPFGLNSTMTNVSQDISLSTIKGSEVVSDPTTPLILECAKRRRKMLVNKDTRNNPVNLATMQRVLRLQPFEKGKGYMQHFNLFGLSSGGRDEGRESLMIDSINAHISIWLDYVGKLKEEGYIFNNISVNLSDIQALERIIGTLGISRETIYKNAFNESFDFLKEYEIDLPKETHSISDIKTDVLDRYGLTEMVSYFLALEERILEPLSRKHPSVNFCFDFSRKEGLGYYQKACYHIFATNSNGRTIQIADGGSVDQLEKLLSSKKEHAVTSGFGTELIQRVFIGE